MKNEIDWEGEARDWLYAQTTVTTAMVDSLTRLLKETAEIHADQRTEKISNEMERRLRRDETSLISSGHSQWHYGYAHGLREAAIYARSFLSKRRTREEVLEEALRTLARLCSCSTHMHTGKHSDGCGISIASLALEWKDTDRHPDGRNP